MSEYKTDPLLLCVQEQALEIKRLGKALDEISVAFPEGHTNSYPGDVARGALTHE